MPLSFEELNAQLRTGTVNRELVSLIYQMWRRAKSEYDPIFIDTKFELLERSIEEKMQGGIQAGAERVPLGFGQESVSNEQYERLMARHNMLLALLGEETIGKTLQDFFPNELTPCTYILKFKPSGTHQSLGDYAALFATVDRLYRFLATFTSRDYFILRWLVGKLPTFTSEHLLSVHSVNQTSPVQIQGAAVTEIADALAKTLSLGDQITKLCLISTRVKEAKLEVERKQLELEEVKRQEAIRADVQQLNLEVEKAKKELELATLRTQLSEEQRKQNKLFQDEVNELFMDLAKALKVLDHLPKELQSDVKVGLQVEIERIHELPFQFIELALRRIK